MRQAVILAGGKGTRLRSVLGDVPKPLVSIGDLPLMGHQLALLGEQGFAEAVLLVSHGASHISEWLRQNYRGPLRLMLRDDGVPCGTAGALLAVLPELAPQFAVLYGDTMLGVDLGRFWAWHDREPDTAVSLMVHPNDHPADSDLVEASAEDRVLRFHSYPHPVGAWLQNLVNAGLYIMARDQLVRFRNETLPLDIAKHLFPKMLRAGGKLRAYNSPEYIKDAGTPDRLERVRSDYEAGRIRRSGLNHPQKAVFLDRDGTLVNDRGHLSRAEDLEVFPFAARAVRRLNEVAWRTVIVTNQPVIARGEASADDLRLIHARLDTELGREHAFIDRLYYCPHHPDAGFPGEVAELKITCDCRKPAAGLIFRARQELNLDLARCWMVGDSTADLGAAEHAGVSSILVETGSAGLDERHPFEPSFVRANFAAAVDFILDIYPDLALASEPLLAAVDPGQAIYIGGLSRSGKSTLAGCLFRELRLRGHPVVLIHLDRWIRSERVRGLGFLGRHDFEGIENAWTLLQDRHNRSLSVELPTYSRRTRSRISAAHLARIPQGATVIFEGVTALELAAQHEAWDACIWVDTDEEIRQERFHRYNARRGIDAESSKRLWTNREVDEHPHLLTKGRFAAHRICLDDILSAPGRSQETG